MGPSDWVALAAVLVSALAVLFSWLTARDSGRSQERTSALALRAQENLVADERLWQRRAEVYVRLLEWARREVSPRVTPSGDSPIALLEFLDERQKAEPLPPELAGQAIAFASDEVSTALDRVQRKRQELHTAMRRIDREFRSSEADAQGSDDLLTEGYHLDKLLVDAFEELVRIIRTELQRSRAGLPTEAS